MGCFGKRLSFSLYPYRYWSALVLCFQEGINALISMNGHNVQSLELLQGNFIGETDRTPALLDLLRTHAVEPRLSYMEQALRELRDEGAIRRDIDLRTVTTMCFGTFFGAHLRGERDHLSVAENTARTMWDFIATGQ